MSLIHRYYSATPKCFAPANALLMKHGYKPAQNIQDLEGKLRAAFEIHKNDEDFLHDFANMHPDKEMLLWFADKVREADKTLNKDYSNCIACNSLNAAGTQTTPVVDAKKDEMINTIIVSGAILIGAVVLVKLIN